jgi:hypothetical protein
MRVPSPAARRTARQVRVWADADDALDVMVCKVSDPIPAELAQSYHLPRSEA